MDNNSQTEMQDETPINIIDINHASFDQLIHTGEISEELARQIIENRPYQNPDELKSLEGMDDTGFKNIQEKINLKASSHAQVDINHCSLKELVQIPGIGKALANRIIENRPFSSIQEMVEIKGFNASLLENIQPYLLFPVDENIQLKLPSSTQDKRKREVIAISSRSNSPRIIELPPTTKKEKGEAVAEEDEDSYEQELLESELSDNRQLVPYHSASVEEEGEPEATTGEFHEPVPRKASVSGFDMFKIIGIASLISVLLSILLTLAILGLINHSLAFVPQQQYVELDQQVQNLETQVEILSQDIDSLRIRIDSLETVSGRVSTLEKENKKLQETMDDTTTDLKDLQSDYDALSKKTTDIENSIDIFNRFLEELQTLLDNLLTPQP